jgi:hypothetical protein
LSDRFGKGDIGEFIDHEVEQLTQGLVVLLFAVLVQKNVRTSE